MWDPNQYKDITETLDQFIDKEINPKVEQWENDKLFPAKELFKKLGDLGFLGISRSTEYGGLGLSYSHEVAFAETLGRIRCGAIPMAIGVQTNMAIPALERYGSEDLKKEFLAPTIAGDLVASIAVSEESAGSDVANIATTATKKGGDYVINGSKMWITNATQADWFCLLANTSKDNGPHKNKSLFCIPRNAKGLSVSPKFEKLGMWSSDTAQVFFDGVTIPESYRIGEEGLGFIYQMQQFQEERIYAAASTLKQMEMVIDDTAAYTRDRKAFGGTILGQQSVHFKLAELQSEVESLRSLVYRTALEYDQGQDVTKLASMAKFKCGRLIRQVTDSCLQYWGGMGFMWENIAAQFYRDGRLISIGGGADEIMLNIISKELGYFSKKR